MSLFHKLGLIVSIHTELFVLTAMCLVGKKKSVSWYHQHLSRLLHVTHSMESLVFIFNLMWVWQKLLRQAVTLCPPTGLGCPGEHWAADTASTGGPAPPLTPACLKQLQLCCKDRKVFIHVFFSPENNTIYTFFPPPYCDKLIKRGWLCISLKMVRALLQCRKKHWTQRSMFSDAAYLLTQFSILPLGSSGNI